MSLVLVSHDVQNGISYDFDFVRWPLHFEFPSYTSVVGWTQTLEIELFMGKLQPNCHHHHAAKPLQESWNPVQ